MEVSTIGHAQDNLTDPTLDNPESPSTTLIVQSFTTVPLDAPDAPPPTVTSLSSLGKTSLMLQSKMPSTLLSIPLSASVLGSFAVAMLFIIVFVLARRRKSSVNGASVLLTGPTDAGKTSIFSALVYERALPSHTSLQTNASFVTLPSSEKKPRTLHLLDIPGHPRIRDQFKEHLSEAKGIVFVVDASTIARNGAAVAEHLHHILHALTSLPPSHSLPSLVILAHKSDLIATTSSSIALAVSRVRTILERELEKRKSAQAGGVGVSQLGEDEGADTELGGLECTGPAGGKFTFKDWEGGEIEILGSSIDVSRGSIDPEKVPDGLAAFRQWLDDLP